MKRLLPIFVVTLAVASAVAQDSKAAAADRVMQRGIQCELLNQLMPLLFTKEQWRKVLPAIEEARETVKKTQRLETEELAPMEQKLNDAYTEAIEKGELPKKELIAEFQKKVRNMETVRKFIANDNIAKVLEKFRATANQGQIRTAIGSVVPHDYGYKADELKDEDRLKMFVSEILLNPLSYEIMRKLSI